MPTPPVTVDTLRAILAAFNRHDLDAIMSFFADDCSFDMPRGPEPWGQRHVGKARVREALASRFKGIPDVHYGDDAHFVAGDRGASEWTLTGTTTSGARVEMRGCDLWSFRDGALSAPRRRARRPARGSTYRATARAEIGGRHFDASALFDHSR